MAQNLATPGVYVEEKNAFPNSVAGIPTAVPAFIGYTEKTRRDGQSLVNMPVRINSLTEYHNIFGSGTKSTFNIQPANGDENFDFEVGDNGYKVVPDSSSRFLFYESIKLFFANGGGSCYIVSAGAFASTEAAGNKASKDAKGAKAGDSKSAATVTKPNTISKKALSEGVKALIGEDEPTMVVIPEAVMLDEGDCYSLQQELLTHCGYKMKSRFAILDVPNGNKARTYDKSDVITRFREGVGSNFLAYGAAYYPWVYTSIVENDEVNYKNISNVDVLQNILNTEADTISANAKKADEVKAEIKKMDQDGADVEGLTQTLNVISPAFKKVMQGIRTHLNIMPPSAAMAGLYSMVDGERGVWKAPANISINSVISPVIKLTNDDQEDLNVTVTGKSVNAIRSFVGEGTKVWGARTLDGNSQDWRYVNVRRTITFIEQSVKAAAKSYVYEPNNSGTWVLIRSMISSFLNDIWRQGGLVGLTPTDAYEVNVGIGSTMTPNDVLDGIMRITVKVAVARPAEFIVITFQQKMQEA